MTTWGGLTRWMYTGTDVRFLGCTALGKEVSGQLLVQVDQFENMWSHGWHPVTEHDWVICNN